MIELGPNRYGKAAIRLVKVIREPDRHRVRDLTVSVALEGDFERAHTAGDNAGVIATDTMKNTVYALAAEHLSGPIEDFGRRRRRSLPPLRPGRRPPPSRSASTAGRPCRPMPARRATPSFASATSPGRRS